MDNKHAKMKSQKENDQKNIKSYEREEIEMLRSIRNTAIFLSAVFSWGIVGSLELERLTLSEGMGYIFAAALLCGIIILIEFGVYAAKLLLTVYAIRRKRTAKRSYAGKRIPTERLSV